MSWLAATGQRWKLAVFVIAMLGAIAVFFSASAPALQGHTLDCAVGGTALFLFSFVWLGRAIRCPHCGGRAGWFAVRRRPLGSWLTDLMTWRSCPMCGR